MPHLKPPLANELFQQSDQSRAAIKNLTSRVSEIDEHEEGNEILVTEAISFCKVD